MADKFCGYCGKKFPENMAEDVAFCPYCGKTIKEAEVKAEPDEKSEKKSLPAVKSDRKVKSKLIAALVLFVLLFAAFFVIKGNILTGDDKKAYNLVLDASVNFKNPSSVRLVSGTLGVEKNCMFARISATNGWGATTTGYYFISEGGSIFEDEAGGSLYTDVEALNIKKINKALTKKFKN